MTFSVFEIWFEELSVAAFGSFHFFFLISVNCIYCLISSAAFFNQNLFIFLFSLFTELLYLALDLC